MFIIIAMPQSLAWCVIDKIDVFGCDCFECADDAAEGFGGAGKGGSRTARTGGGDFDDGVEVVGHDAIDVEADVGGVLFDLLAGGFDDLAKLI